MILYEEPLKIEWEEDKLIVNDVLHPHTVRTTAEMQQVLMEKEKKPSADIAYYMFRELIAAEDLRYDITVIPSLRYGSEYAKTFGHYHPMAEKGLSYPEIYHVLRGSAAFVLQKINRDESVTVTVVRAMPGQVLLIPPNYGHASINLGEEPLVLGNVVSGKFSSEYGPYKKNQGAAVYYTHDGIIRNTNYLIRGVNRATVDKINNQYGFMCQDLLKEFHNLPSKFDYLNKPSLMFRED